MCASIYCNPYFKRWPQKNNMAMENPPFEDVFPIEHGDFPASHVSFRECTFFLVSFLTLLDFILPDTRQHTVSYQTPRRFSRPVL